MATKRAFLAVTEAPLMGLVSKVKISFNPFDPRSVRARYASLNILSIWMREMPLFAPEF
jgi:hypothetical protein